MILAALFLCTVATIHDGDTLHCADDTRVRLAGIDAPEMRRCPRNRVCAPGDPVAARDTLQTLVAGQVLRCEHVGWSYRRRVAWCSNARGDLSCQLLRAGVVVRWEAYDLQNRLRGCL